MTQFLTTFYAQRKFGSEPRQSAFFVTIGQSNNAVADMAAETVNIGIVCGSISHLADYSPLHVTIAVGKGL